MFGRRSRSSERLRQSIRDEIAFYLEMRIKELMREGMSRTDAELEARASFGPVDAIEAACVAERGPETGDRRRLPMFESLLQDVRFAGRSFRRNPLFVLVAVATLGLGIGASTTMFSVLDAVVISPLPFDRPEELVVVGTTWRTPEGATPPEVARMSSAALSSASAPNFLDWKARSTSFQAMAGAVIVPDVWVGEGEPQRVRFGNVTAEFFGLLGVSAQWGRGFTADDFAPGAPRVALLSEAFWRRQFGADSAAIGQTVTAVGEPFTVVGILPESFRPPEALWLGRPDLWMPVNFSSPRSAAEAETFAHRGARIMRVVARLVPGVTLEAAQQELDALGRALIAEYPDDLIFRGTESHVAVDTLHRQTVGSAGKTIAMLFGAVGMLLLIACVNVANLSLARGMDRRRELAVRRALAANRLRVVRQLLTESVLLSMAGGALGVVLAFLGVRLFKVLSPGGIPRLAEVGVDGRVLGYAIGASVLAGVAFGAAPAMQSWRHPVGGVLQGTGRSTGGRRRAWARQSLVFIETAIALVLLIGAGLLMNSYVRLINVDPGFDPEHVVAMQINLGYRGSGWARGGFGDDPSPGSPMHFFTEVLDRVRQAPGVTSVASIMNPPIGDVFWRTRVVADLPDAALEAAPSANMHTVTSNYFATMRIPIRRGRPIEASDRSGSPLVAVVNESFASSYWPNGEAVGGRIRIAEEGEDSEWITVVGVSSDVRQMGLDQEVLPEVYLPYAQRPWLPIQTVVVRYDGELGPLVSAMRRAVWVAEPTVPLPLVQTMEDRLTASVGEPRFLAVLLTCFGAIALLLSVGGVYATLLYTVRRRTREMGIRMALGAVRSDVVRLVVRQGLSIVLLGVVAGTVVAVLLRGVLARFVFGISTTDPGTFLGITGVFLLAALIACYLPARRATTVDPVQTLRTD